MFSSFHPFRREDGLRWQLVAVAVLTLAAGLIYCGCFFANRTLAWDTVRLFSLFRDNLHSLNIFGEIQWWDPVTPTGFPVYYFSILGHNCATPLFVGTGILAWLLGLAGIHLHSYLELYIIYFGFISPLLFSLGFLLLARQVLSGSRPVAFALILAAFSPGVVMNLTDPWVMEQAAYGVFFAAACLSHLRTPGKRSFLLLLLSIMVLGVSLNHLFLYWNIFFVPFFVLATVLFPNGDKAWIRKAAAAVPRSWLAGAAALAVLSVLPTIITYAQGSDIYRSTLGARTYEYRQLIPGNPLEVVAASTPGVGFNWIKEGRYTYRSPDAQWIPVSSEGEFKSYGYLGILCLPLAFLGLAFGRPPWRNRLLFLIAAVSAVILLSGYSPIFSGVLALPGPLRAVNHFSDTPFRLGLFFLLILAAGLGAERLLEGRRFHRRVFAASFAISALFSVALFIAVSGLPPGGMSPAFRTVFGFLLIMIFLFAVYIARLSFSGNESRREKLVTALLLLTLVDVSSASFLHMRETIWGMAVSFKNSPIDQLGPGDPRLRRYTDTVLTLRGVKQLSDRGLDPAAFPKTAFSSAARARPAGDPLKPGDTPELAYVGLPERFRADPAFARFFDAGPGPAAGKTLVSGTSSYNRLHFEVETEQDALFFVRDAYSPYWKARVNGEPVGIAPAFGAFKAVPVPAGRSRVDFTFKPPALPLALLTAYLAIILVGVGAALPFSSRRLS
jgi:hypothetical protein